jgi:hypothetical protein
MYTSNTPKCRLVRANAASNVSRNMGVRVTAGVALRAANWRDCDKTTTAFKQRATRVVQTQTCSMYFHFF